MPSNGGKDEDKHDKNDKADKKKDKKKKKKKCDEKSLKETELKYI